MSQALGLLLYQNMLYFKKPSRPPPSRKRDFRSFLREIRPHVCLVCTRVRMHEVPRIPCFSASAAMRALSLRAFTRRRERCDYITYLLSIQVLASHATWIILIGGLGFRVLGFGVFGLGAPVVLCVYHFLFGVSSLNLIT